MLVAERRNYEYEVYVPSEDEKKSSHIRKPKKRTHLKQRIMPMIMLLICFGACSLLISRYVIISNNNNEIVKLQQEYSNEKIQTDMLKMKLEAGTNLNNIRNIAGSKLGMAYPQQNQVKYMQLPKTNDNSSSKSKINDNKKQQKKGFINELISIIERVL